jgi:3-hydroxy-3-methylglutaryl CoA synthase
MDGDALAAEIKTSVPDMEDADIVAMAVAARRRLLGRSGHPGHAVGDS